MKYALIENGVVTNTIALLPYNAADFPNAVNTKDRPVQIGDTYDGERFFRNGKEVHTEIEEKDITIDRMNAAGAEAMQALNSEPPVSAGVFTYGEWMPNVKYKQYAMFQHNGNPYFAKKEHTSLEMYPPDIKGVESLYGARPSPDIDGIYPYIYNMAVELGMKVRSAKDSNIYECYANATDTLLNDPVDVPAIFRLAE